MNRRKNDAHIGVAYCAELWGRIFTVVVADLLVSVSPSKREHRTSVRLRLYYTHIEIHVDPWCLCEWRKRVRPFVYTTCTCMNTIVCSVRVYTISARVRKMTRKCNSEKI